MFQALIYPKKYWEGSLRANFVGAQENSQNLQQLSKHTIKKNPSSKEWENFVAILLTHTSTPPQHSIDYYLEQGEPNSQFSPLNQKL